MKIVKFVSIILFIPIILIIKIINPVLKIRWSTSYFPDRIGHLVAELEHYLYLTKNKSIFCIDIFPKHIFYNSNPCNTFLQKHYRKKLITIDTKIIILLQRSQKIVENYFKFIKFETIDKLLSTKDNFKIINKNFKPSILFSKGEKIKIKKQLKEIGLKKNQKFICLIARDSRYLKNRMNFDTSYHDYRDCNIENFTQGIKYLLNKDFFVFRMGKLQKKKLNLKNKNYLDYAFSKYRSDILDVWLMANCEFCISTGTGFDQISRVFKKPILYVNQLPFTDWPSFSRSLTHPKFMFDLKKKKFFDLKSYVEHSYHRMSEYKKNKIKIIDLNKNEILYCIKEFLQIMISNWNISSKRKKKQNKLNNCFKNFLLKYHPKIDFHQNIHKDALVSNNFLEKNKRINL